MSSPRRRGSIKSGSKMKKISNFEWTLLLAVAILIDIVQIILNFFGIGLGLNRYITLLAAMSLLTYLGLRGVRPTAGRLLSLFGTFLGEEIPGADMFFFWSIEVWFLWSSTSKEEKEKARLAADGKT